MWSCLNYPIDGHQQASKGQNFFPMSAKKGKTEQPEPGEKPKMPAKVKVEGFTIEGRLKMALSDPLIRSTLLFGNSRRTDSQAEFIDSPFAKEPNRYSEFHSWGDYQIHDDCSFRTIFMAGSLFSDTFLMRRTRRLSSKPRSLPIAREVACGSWMLLIPVEDIQSLISVSKDQNGGDLWVNRLIKDKVEHPFNPSEAKKSRRARY